MSYFLNCAPYEFTQGQIDVMFDNYNSPARSNIRKSYIPDTTAISSDYALIEPEGNAELEYYNKILLDWEDAENANNYLITLNDQSGNTTEIIVEDSEYLLEELEPDIFYFWDISPFNDGFTDVVTQSSFFKTGSDFNTSTKDLSKTITDINVYPNPSQAGQRISIAMTLPTATEVSIQIHDIKGNVVLNQSNSLLKGKTDLPLDMQDVSSGIYIVKISTVDGVNYQKINVQ